MKLYKTNAALGYKQYAILIQLNKSSFGYDYYLCVELHNVDSDNNLYQIGKVVEDLDDIFIEEYFETDEKKLKTYQNLLATYYNDTENIFERISKLSDSYYIYNENDMKINLKEINELIKKLI